MMKLRDKGFTPLHPIIPVFKSGNDGCIKFKSKRNPRSNGWGVTGFTLIELLLTFGILAFCLCGLLLTYLNMFFLTDLSRDLILATNSIQAQMESVKRTAFDNLAALDGTVFNVAGFTNNNAIGRIEVTNTDYGDLRRVRLLVFFRSRNRIFGEDLNLNGQFDGGEDANANNRLDSPVEMVTLISR